MGIGDAIRRALSSWTKKEGPHGDIVLGTRVRLARNSKDVPFPGASSKEQLQSVLDQARSFPDVLKDEGSFVFYDMAEMDALDRDMLVEKHLISPNHARHTFHRGVILRSDEDISIMVNEEDHLRIQVLFPGLQLQQAWKHASRVDDCLESKFGYAFDKERGYLTACPTNVGTGMRASVMLHLPALARVNRLREVLGTVSQFGLVVRGLYGEGSESYGNIYQLSNQVTLGHREEEMIEHLERVTKQIIQSERQAREYLSQPERRLAVEDTVYRAFGILSFARILSTEEAMQLLSDVRLGMDLGFIHHLDKEILKELMVMIRAAHLQKIMGQNLPPEERDKLRASLVREKLNPQALKKS